MKIIACIKQVASFYVHNGVDARTRELVTDGFEYIVNPYDEVAVEEAIRMKERLGDGEVTVITYGPGRATKALRWCLAMGADHAIHIHDETPSLSDPWRVSEALAHVIEERDYDLLLCGRIAIDDHMGQVGFYVGERLQVPVVAGVSEIKLIPGERRAAVLRALDRGNREALACPLPALFTVDKSLNRPRYPTLSGRQIAKRKRIERIVPGQQSRPLSDPKLCTEGIAPPKIKPKKILSPDNNLSAAGRMQFVMSGGMEKKSGGKLGGDPANLAKGIFDFLKEKKMVTSPPKNT